MTSRENPSPCAGPRLAALPLLAVLAGLAAGCPRPSAAPDAGPPRMLGSGRGASSGSLLEPAAAVGPLDRPPHPTMATSSHGLAALETLAAAAGPAAGPVTAAQALALLASGEDGAETRARSVAAQAWKVAAAEAGRVDAAAAVMLSLVMDPDPRGWRDRLTDAYGMVLYASALKGGGSALSEGARAVVYALAGRAREATDYAQRLTVGDSKDEWLRFCEGMARAALGRRGDALDAFNAAVASTRAGPRVYLERARLHLALGDHASARADADTALKTQGACSACRLVRGQAMALGDDPAAVDEGLRDLAALAGTATMPAYWKSEALLAAGVADARRGQGPAVESVAKVLGGLKDATAEAALAAGLAANLQGDHAAAVLALDRAVKGLPSGMLRAEGLAALARSALREKDTRRAGEALRAWEQESGGSPESALLAADLARAGDDAATTEDELLRAWLLDPYVPVGSNARKARPGGAAASRRYRQAWRILAAGAPRAALAMAHELAKQDPGNPGALWLRVAAQRGVDAQLGPGESPSQDAARYAAELVKQLGKTTPSSVLPRQARREVLLALDEGERNLTADALRRMMPDPDPVLNKMATEANARGAPRPRENMLH